MTQTGVKVLFWARTVGNRVYSNGAGSRLPVVRPRGPHSPHSPHTLARTLELVTYFSFILSPFLLYPWPHTCACIHTFSYDSDLHPMTSVMTQIAIDLSLYPTLLALAFAWKSFNWRATNQSPSWHFVSRGHSIWTAVLIVHAGIYSQSS